MRRSQRIKRDKRIVKMREEHPEYTYEDIGDKVGLTPSGVARVIQRCCPETVNKYER